MVEYYESFVNPTETQMWIVMEYMAGGDLANKILYAQKQKISIPESEIWKFFLQVLQGISDLHKNNIIHRDIKPANIFLSNDFQTAKIGDMNVSKVLKSDLTSTQIGTPYYLSPEIWRREEYNSKCDIFSLGCLTYELATLKHPYEANSQRELEKKVTQLKTPDITSDYSPELNYIIKKCLIKDPEMRPSAKELIEHVIVMRKSQEYQLEHLVFKKMIQEGWLNETIQPTSRISDLNRLLPNQ